MVTTPVYRSWVPVGRTMVAMPWLCVRASAWSYPAVVQLVAANAGLAAARMVITVVAPIAVRRRARGMRGPFAAGRSPQRCHNISTDSTDSICGHPVFIRLSWRTPDEGAAVRSRGHREHARSLRRDRRARTEPVVERPDRRAARGADFFDTVGSFRDERASLLRFAIPPGRRATQGGRMRHGNRRRGTRRAGRGAARLLPGTGDVSLADATGARRVRYHRSFCQGECGARREPGPIQRVSGRRPGVGAARGRPGRLRGQGVLPRLRDSRRSVRRRNRESPDPAGPGSTRGHRVGSGAGRPLTPLSRAWRGGVGQGIGPEAAGTLVTLAAEHRLPDGLNAILNSLGIP